MIDFNDGIMEIMTSIIAAMIVTMIGSIGTIIFTKIKNRKKANLYKRIKEANLVNFFYDRNVLNSDSGSVGDDIKRAEKEVFLIGSWLTSANNEEFRRAVCERAEAGVEFYFCFNKLDYNTIEIYAKFINSNVEDIVQSLYNTYARVFEIKKELSAEPRNKIHIYSHNQMLVTAFWGFDINHKKAKKRRYKLDHKLVKGEISHSYGIEFCYTKKCEFSSNIRDAYMFVLDNANKLDNIDDLLNESSQINKNMHDIINKNFK
ncbi:hypothetical protein NXH76_29005 [Blautia schinkii]|nr:hypothetical protein [Blautia schinkii]